jgi:hypothetical protein
VTYDGGTQVGTIAPGDYIFVGGCSAMKVTAIDSTTITVGAADPAAGAGAEHGCGTWAAGSSRPLSFATYNTLPKDPVTPKFQGAAYDCQDLVMPSDFGTGQHTMAFREKVETHLTEELVSPGAKALFSDGQAIQVATMASNTLPSPLLSTSTYFVRIIPDDRTNAGTTTTTGSRISLHSTAAGAKNGGTGLTQDITNVLNIQSGLNQVAGAAPTPATWDGVKWSSIVSPHSIVVSITKCMRWHASAGEVAAAINALQVVVGGDDKVVGEGANSGVEVVRSGSGDSSSSWGYTYSVRFKGQYLRGDLPLVNIITGSSFCPRSVVPGATVTVAEKRSGATPVRELTTTSGYSGEAWGAQAAHAVGQSFRVLAKPHAVQRLIIKDSTAAIAAGSKTFALELTHKTSTATAYGAGNIAQDASGVITVPDHNRGAGPFPVYLEGTFPTNTGALAAAPKKFIAKCPTATTITLHADDAAQTLVTFSADLTASQRLDITFSAPAVATTVMTAPIQWNAADTVMEEELNKLANVANDACVTSALYSYAPAPDGSAADTCKRAIHVTRHTDGTLAPNGLVFDIFFSGTAVSGTINDLVVKNMLNFDASTSVTVTTTVNGFAPPSDSREDNVFGAVPRLFSASYVPLAPLSDATARSSATFLGGATTSTPVNVDIFKTNGHLWTVSMDTYLGDMAAMTVDRSQLNGASAACTVTNDLVKGTLPVAQTVAPLQPGIEYSMRVSAQNSMGYGPVSNVVTKIPMTVPDPILTVSAGHATHVDEVQTVTTAATHIDEVQTITTSARVAPEVQMVTTSAAEYSVMAGTFAVRFPELRTITLAHTAPVTAGAFTLAMSLCDPTAPTTCNLKTTAVELPFNAAASDVEDALNNVAVLGANAVTVTRSGDGSSTYNYGYTWTVSFTGDAVRGALHKKTDGTDNNFVIAFPTTALLPATATLTTSITNTDNTLGTDTEIQTVSVSAPSALTYGAYRLTFVHGSVTQTTACINWDATATQVEMELEALSNIDSVHVVRSGDATDTPNVPQFGYKYTVFFDGNVVRNNVADLTSTIGAAATGGACTEFSTTIANVVTAVTGEAVTIVEQDAGISIPTPGGGTPRLQAGANAALASDFKADLEQIPFISSVVATRSLADLEGGYSWTVAMTGSSDADLGQLVCNADTTFSNVAGAACSVSTLADGNVNGGTFLLSGSPAIPYDATAQQMKAALEATNGIGSVEVTRTPPTLQRGFTWTVTFTTDIGDIPMLVATNSLTGTDSSIEIREFTKGNQLAGSFKLTYDGQTTAAIAYDAPATGAGSVKAALESLTTVGLLDVTRSSIDTQRGYSWLATFRDIRNGGDTPMLIANAADLSGIGSVVHIRETVVGSEATGTKLWVSFEPPATRNGSPISKYQVQWDTSATFATSNLQSFDFNQDAYLYEEQQIITSANSKTTSAAKVAFSKEVQRISIPSGAGTATFRLTFKGVESGDITIGTDTWMQVAATLSAIPNVGAVTVQPVIAVTGVNRVVQGTGVNKGQIEPNVAHGLTVASTVAVRISGTIPANSAALTSGTTYYALVVSTTHFTLHTATPATAANVVTYSADLLIGESLVIAQRCHTSSDSCTTPSAGSPPTVGAGASFDIIFDSAFGALPLLLSSDSTKATVATTEIGSTPYRKEVQSFVCTATGGTFTVTLGDATPVTVNWNDDAVALKTKLESLPTVNSPSGITVWASVAGAGRPLCASATPDTIFVRFDRNHGDVDALTFVTALTGAGAGIAQNDDSTYTAGITTDGGIISGTFSVAFGGSTTGVLNSGVTAVGMRNALEVLPSISTAAVTRDWSKQLLEGKLDTVAGQTFVTCSAGEMCAFAGASHGVPGDLISIEGSWYRVYASDDDHGLSATKLYLADIFNNPIGFAGNTATGVAAYEWAKGYHYTTVLQLITVPPQSMTAPIARLYPADASVRITGRSCVKCYYLPTGTNAKLTMGVPYHINVFSHNEVGASGASNALSATPRQIPSMPASVSLAVVSGTQVEVFFSPPTLPTDAVAAGYKDDISSYTVQWDTVPTFLHGTSKCTTCASAFADDSTDATATYDVVTVSTDMMATISPGDYISVGACTGTQAMKVHLVAAGKITVFKAVAATPHGCPYFTGQENSVTLHRFSPATVTGLAIQGTPPFKYTIEGLTPGVKYYVRVAARNSVAVQPVNPTSTPPDNTNWSGTLDATTAHQKPTAPVSVSLSVRSRTSITATFAPPLRDGKGTHGTAITHFKIEWDSVSAFTTAQSKVVRNTDPFEQCSSCATSVTVPTSPAVTTIAYTSATSLASTLMPGDLIKLKTPNGWAGAAWECDDVLTVDTVTGSAITVLNPTIGGHSCSNVAGQTLVVESGFVLNTLGTSRVININALTPGTPYYVRVSAMNSEGYSLATNAPSALAPMSAPDKPASVSVTTIEQQDTPITHLTTGWNAPAINGGSPVLKYKVEWWTAKVISEVQVIQVTWPAKPAASGPINGGQNALTIGFYSDVNPAGYIEQQMHHDASEINMRAAIMNLGAGARNIVGDVTVTRTPINTDKGFSWTVTFNDAAKNVGNIPELIMQGSTALIANCPTCTYNVYQAVGGQRAASATVSGSNEVQRITTDDATSAVSGWWRAKFRGSEYTQYLPHDVSADALRDALEGLTTMGKLTVTRPAKGTKGYSWLITFVTNVGDQPAIMLDQSKMAPSSVNMNTQPLTVYDGDNSAKTVGSYATNNLVPSGSGGGEPRCKTCVVGEQPVEYGSFETADASVLTYQIPSLVPGTNYHIAVTAKNARGYGERQFSTPAQIAPPQQTPGKPTGVAVAVQYGDYQRLQVSYAPPLSDGGSDITKYRVEWDTSSSFPNPGKEEFICPNSNQRAVWTVDTEATGGNIDTGWWSISLKRNGLTYNTAPMPFDAKASRAEEVGGSAGGSKVICDESMINAGCDLSHVKESGSVEAKLEALDVVNDVSVVRSALNANGKGGYTWTITFNDDGDDFELQGAGGSQPCDGSLGPPDISDTCKLTKGLPNTLTDVKVTATKHLSAACAGLAPCGLTTSNCAGCTYTSCSGTRAVATTGGLTKGQLYFVRVFAYNRNGYSPPQVAAAPQKPMVIPSAPTGTTLQVVSAYQLKVIFSPPDDNGGDTITKYLVEWSLDINFATSSSAIVSALTGSAPFFYTIGSLTSKLMTGAYYYVRVSCANSQGYGPTVRTSPNKLNPSEPPQAPMEVYLGSTSPSMLTVTFAPPISDGGDTVTKYEIEWDQSPTFNSLTGGAKVQVAATERSYTMSTLTPNVIYYVRVFAVNGRGVGSEAKASPQFKKPQLQVPGVPVMVLAEQPVPPTTKKVKVTWNRPRIPHHGYPCFGTAANPTNCPTYVSGSDPMSDGGAAITKYKIQFSASPAFLASATFEKEVTNSATQYTLGVNEGVQSGVKYYVRVMAYNSEGFSNPCGNTGPVCSSTAPVASTTTT